MIGPLPQELQDQKPVTLLELVEFFCKIGSNPYKIANDLPVHNKNPEKNCFFPPFADKRHFPPSCHQAKTPVGTEANRWECSSGISFRNRW
jgi:hypothetical protein